MGTLRDTMDDEAAQADDLREAMIAELREMTAIRSNQVDEAFRAVPRHLFAPGEPLERAYAVKTILQTKRDERGAAISMVSAPDIQAMMLNRPSSDPVCGFWRLDRAVTTRR
ncbi:MAG: hypothetical protein ACRDU0_18395 [Mycobacterium sp.]